MLQLGRIVRQWPILKDHYCALAAYHRSPLSHSLPPKTKTTLHRFASTRVHSARRNTQRRSGGLILPKSPVQSDLQVEQNESDSESEGFKSRNQLKREAQRAVRWGMELVSFSTPQIKRILSVASLDNDVFEALNLAKKLGPDVREGKRRQFNYIGKLLRDVEPELMDTLIQATKDGDHSKLRTLVGSKASIVEDSEDEYEETDSEEEVEEFHIDIATRWLDGLISKDIEITNEVYSIHNVDFDRQELRNLVRRVHKAQEKHKNAVEENKGEIDAAVSLTKRSLKRFLLLLMKQMPSA
ncbi:uncharacterized protein LOC133807081 [Humulus lupulus]|uniref:uncharacterized protein LOC133807081 n=1 Tax=Humulus lupulus TaxID=3486 RepID=UPI002B414F61|nr:uncharacterized protein LOC133807081 [Humulus lupulus]